jgi:hypothetical protein
MIAGAATSAAPASAAPATAVGSDDCSGQQVPQQCENLCAQQQELHMEVLRASLLDSLTYHQADPLSASSSSSSSYQSLSAQDSIEQLALASIVAHIHTDSIPSAVQDSAATKRQRSFAGTAAAARGDSVAVLRCLQQLVANGIAIKPFLSAGPDDRWGLGLYPVTAAVVNHNCEPNCSIRYRGCIEFACHLAPSSYGSMCTCISPLGGHLSWLAKQLTACVTASI